MPKGGAVVREFFLLREAEAHAVSVADRSVLDASIVDLDEKRLAVEELWANGATGEALRAAESALGDFAPEGSPRDRYNALRAELERRIAERRQPTVAEVRKTRRARLTIATVLVLSMVSLAILEATRKPKPPVATASASWDVRYPPENAVDGSDATDWVLPDKTLGWLDLALKKPRKVTRIAVTNTRNPPWYDRGTKEFRVEIFLGDKLIAARDLRFETASLTPQTLHVDVGATIDRVRLTVVSYHLSGGGFSEVTLE
jgi:hypothetical protein